MGRVLVIDDDRALCDMMVELVRRVGHKGTRETTIAAGLARLESEPFDLVFLDVQMPDGNGLDALAEIKRRPDSPEVIVMTGFSNPREAEEAILNGAWDYVSKPVSPRKLMLPLTRVFQYLDNARKAKKPAVVLKQTGIIANSKAMKACLDLVAQAAAVDASVLIAGETGTGKELFARAIHENSSRASGNLVVVDCAGLPETLVESTLFGHRKGAFTGADRDQKGLVEQAHNGTLFLDEIGELPMGVQKSFLRVLQERRFRPVGGGAEKTSNFRLVAATNRNLEKMAEEGGFRKDLLYRVNSITITLPPLRGRPDDIRDMAVYHANRLAKAMGAGAKALSPEYLETLTAYPWPGNVRELVNVVEYSLAAAVDEPELFVKHLPPHVRVRAIQASMETGKAKEPPRPPGQTTLASYKAMREAVLADAEKAYLQDLMIHTRGDIQKACRIAELGRTRLYALLKKHNISRSGWDLHMDPGTALSSTFCG
ncbi:MAG: sigma-54-dependent Fis family transcriptional regulator [Deltaproteobacteria bacterium]|nr:sigma-54-dependent Fis family transcriptional regulator [Deltaproteobacteria bacterium]